MQWAMPPSLVKIFWCKHTKVLILSAAQSGLCCKEVTPAGPAFSPLGQTSCASDNMA